MIKNCSTCIRYYDESLSCGDCIYRAEGNSNWIACSDKQKGDEDGKNKNV